MVLNFTAELEPVEERDAEYSGHAVGIVRLNGREVFRFPRLSTYLHDEDVAALFAERMVEVLAVASYAYRRM